MELEEGSEGRSLDFLVWAGGDRGENTLQFTYVLCSLPGFRHIRYGVIYG